LERENPDGSGIYVQPGAHVEFKGGGAVIWGARNAGYGLDVDVNAEGDYDTNARNNFFITGTLGNLALAGLTTAEAFVQNLGGYSNPIALTWANLFAALNAGGFGDNAHNLSRNVHFSLNTLGTANNPSELLVTNGTSPVTFNTESICLADVSGGVVTVNMPPAAGRTFLKTREVVNSNGSAAVSNITVSGNGVNIENPNVPGTFAASVTMSVAGASVTWYFDVGNNRWKIV